MPNFIPFPKGTGAAHAFDSKPIASGPYKVANYDRGTSLKLVRNPKWKASTDKIRAARPDAFEWTFGLDGATIDERMLAGQGTDADAIPGNAGTIQPATLSRIQTPQLKARTLSGYGGCTTYMGMNTTRKYLSDLRVRKAIEYAVDKDTVVAATGGAKLATKANTIQSPTMLGRTEYDLYPHNLAKARQLLAEAGASGGFTLTLDNRPEPRYTAQAVAIQEALKPLKIKVKINNIDTSSFYEVIGTTAKQRDLAITGWCPDWPSGADLPAAAVRRPQDHSDREHQPGAARQRCHQQAHRRDRGDEGRGSRQQGVRRAGQADHGPGSDRAADLREGPHRHRLQHRRRLSDHRVQRRHRPGLRRPQGLGKVGGS